MQAITHSVSYCWLFDATVKSTLPTAHAEDKSLTIVTNSVLILSQKTNKL